MSSTAALYDWNIHLYPVDSAHGEGWHQADCDICGWYTTGHETVCEDAAYEHLEHRHSDLITSGGTSPTGTTSSTDQEGTT